MALYVSIQVMSILYMYINYKYYKHEDITKKCYCTASFDTDYIHFNEDYVHVNKRNLAPYVSIQAIETCK